MSNYEGAPVSRARTLLVLRPVNHHQHLGIEEVEVEEIERNCCLASCLRGATFQHGHLNRRNTSQSAQTLLQPDNTH